MSIIETADVTPATSAEPAAPQAEVDLFDDAAVTTFPREYVEKLRREAGDYRTKYAPFRDTFDGADEDVQEYLLGVNRMLLTPGDKTDAIAELKDLLKHLEPNSEAAEAVEAKLDEIDEDAPLTLRQWNEIQAKKSEKEKGEADIATIYSTAKALDPSYDKDGDEYGDLASLLFIASNKTKGDLGAAHKLRADRFSAAVEAEVERRLGDIKTGARKWAPITSTGDAPIEPKDEPKTYAEARKRGDSRIARILQQG